MKTLTNEDAMIKLAISDVCSAFSPKTVGTKADADLIHLIKDAVESYPFDAQEVPGQGFVPLPPEACNRVKGGVGRRSEDPEAYVCRFWRERVEAFLKRGYASPVDSVVAVVYTVEAYFADPEVTLAEKSRLIGQGATHVIVAVLGFCGPKAPVSPYRFVANLAGANRAAASWSAEYMRLLAKEVIAYDKEWCVVAD